MPSQTMLGPVAAAALLTWLTACADDPPLEPAALAEVCGAAGPFHLLPLAPDERLGADLRSFAILGDRLFFVAGQGQRFVSPALGPVPLTTTVYAVGPCGDDPIPVARDLEIVFVDPHWPDLLLGCSATDRDLVRVDPSGASAPTLLASRGCTATITDHGLLGYTITDDDLVSADFYPLLDAKAPVFGPPIQVAAPVPIINATSGSVALLPDEVLLVESDGDLGTGIDPRNPIGDINLLDRTNGTSILDVPVGQDPSRPLAMSTASAAA